VTNAAKRRTLGGLATRFCDLNLTHLGTMKWQPVINQRPSCNGLVDGSWAGRSGLPSPGC
jgi:hypothetical protein